MVRKTRKSQGRRNNPISSCLGDRALKGDGISNSEQTAKAEKARYERFRRRRWGIMNKVSEYVEKFGAQACVIVSDRYQTHYFTSDEWIREPKDIPGAIRVYGRSRRGMQRGGSIESDISCTSTNRGSELPEIRGVSTNYVASLRGLRTAFRNMAAKIEMLQWHEA